MPKIMISDSALFAAAMVFVSDEQARWYLHGVHIEPAEGGGILLSATDGTALFRAYDAEGSATAPCIVAMAGGKPPAGWHNKPGLLEIDTEAGTARHATAPLCGVRNVDGAFPDVLRVIPREFSGEVAQFGWHVLDKVRSAARILGRRRTGGDGKAVCITHNGAGPAMVTFPGHDDCFAIMTPYRLDEAPATPPAMPHAAAKF